MNGKRKGARARSVVLPAGVSRPTQIGFSDERWQRIRSVIPDSLDPAGESALQVAISNCCDNYLSAARLLQEGARTAASIRKPGGKQSAPLESLAKHLRGAASAWAEVEGMYDDRLGPLSDLGKRLAELATDAERRLAVIGNLKAAKPIDARKQLILLLARSCQGAGLRPTVHGRAYENSDPTWFQQFVAMLNDNLLGAQGWGAPGKYTRNALFAEVARAMRGHRK
jgi:hypothetical protein